MVFSCMNRMTSLLMLDSVLKRIEADNRAEDVWIVGPETGHLLHGLIRVVAPEAVLEIGTSVAYSTLWMASALEKNGKGKVWTVESHAERFELAQRNIEESGLGHRIAQVRGHAPEVLSDIKDLPARIEFAFFDATKQEHKSYFEAVFPHMKKGGFIVVDNVHSHRFGRMQKFIEATLTDNRLKVVEIPVGDGLLIARVL